MAGSMVPQRVPMMRPSSGVRKAHRGVHVVAILDSGKGGARAEVAGDELVHVALQELGGLLPDVAMRSAMCAVLADVQLVHDVARQGVAPCLLRHVVVEGRIGDDHIADGREHLAADLDYVSFCVVVERRERCDLADPGEGLVGDDLGLGEVPAALNDAVADALDLVRIEACLGEDIEDMLHSRLVVGKRDLELLLLAATLLVADEGAIDTDALAVALGIDFAGFRVEQLILQRRAASVDDKYNHESPLSGRVPSQHRHVNDTLLAADIPLQCPSRRGGALFA